ncbi:membrane protein [Aquisalinus flavus]|uniref:Membrane protein n=2 Tax=Aquisalinus flavus TaxID=1526572 RepID=A0A8J2V7H3_9PROT|nr:membrane protein [Aquisalinus flavus]
MEMDNFTPLSATAGGIMIGISAIMLMASLGRIAGISGILGGALSLTGGDRGWRVAFLAGLLLPGVVVLAGIAPRPDIDFVANGWLLALAGLLVGFGTRLGSGCTSGHGVCGLARFSKRSLAATATFMAFGVATVFLIRHIL